MFVGFHSLDKSGYLPARFSMWRCVWFVRDRAKKDGGRFAAMGIISRACTACLFGGRADFLNLLAPGHWSAPGVACRGVDGGRSVWRRYRTGFAILEPTQGFLDVWRRLVATERRFDRAGTLVQIARRKDLEIIGTALHEPAWPAG